MSNVKVVDQPHYIGARIEKATWIKLQKMADENKGSVGQLVRKALDEFIKSSNNIN